MGFSRNNIAFNYKAYRESSNITIESFVWEPEKTPKNGPWISVTEDWVDIINVSSNDRGYTANLNTTLVNKLAVGDHTVEVTFNYRATFLGVYYTVIETFKITVTVTATILLEVSSSYLPFAYIIGQDLPSSKFLSITTENAWDILKDESWITLSATSGNKSSSITVGVDPSGLTSGSYSGQILIDDKYEEKIIKVALTVLGENNTDDFLVVTPETFELVETYQITPTKTKKIVVESSEDFTVSSSESWLSFSGTSFSAGTESFAAQVVDSESLSPGSYQATITINSSYSTKTIQVLLVINSAILEGVESDTLYYADDRNQLSYSNSVTSSELFIQYITTTVSAQYSYEKRAAFFRGVANSLLGQEAKNLIVGFDFLNNITTRCFVPVQPLEMQISVYDKIINSTQQTLRETLTNVQVLTGKTPSTPNWLSYMPEEVTIANKAVLLFSFQSETPPDEIKLSGAASITYDVAALKNGIYSCMIDFSELTLVSGDVVSVLCGGFPIRVNIAPTEPEHVKIAWLNEWNCPELFTCNGNLKVISETDQNTTKYARDGKEVTEVLEVTTPTLYEVYTGFINTRAEVEWLQTIKKAKKIWVEVDGVFIPVIRTFKSLPFYETRNFLDAYKLTFESAEV